MLFCPNWFLLHSDDATLSPELPSHPHDEHERILRVTETRENLTRDGMEENIYSLDTSEGNLVGMTSIGILLQ